LNSNEPLLSAVTRRREREPVPPPAGASSLSGRIGDERLRLEAEILVRFIQSESSIQKPTTDV
jgi:hypothetical protein